VRSRVSLRWSRYIREVSFPLDFRPGSSLCGTSFLRLRSVSTRRILFFFSSFKREIIRAFQIRARVVHCSFTFDNGPRNRVVFPSCQRASPNSLHSVRDIDFCPSNFQSTLWFFERVSDYSNLPLFSHVLSSLVSAVTAQLQVVSPLFLCPHVASGVLVARNFLRS